MDLCANVLHCHQELVKSLYREMMRLDLSRISTFIIT